MSTFTRRLFITFAIPVALYVIAERLLLPGIDEGALRLVPGSHANFGVLALGIAPILTAYWLVEVAAFFVPRWSRLRHGNPEGRAQLDRASRVVALALAAFQGFGIATQLKALPGDGAGFSGIDVSTPLVVISLVGGVCVQFLAARFISQRGLANGFVVLLVASQLGALGESVMARLAVSPTVGPALGHEATPREIGFTVFALALATFATWLVLGRPSAPPLAPAGGEGGSTPYRGARQLVVHPWIPLPASSLQVYFFASAILMFPQTMRGVHIPTGALPDLLQRDELFLPIFIAVMAVATVVFARKMHRTAEMSDLALRLGAKARGKMEDETRAALRRALLPTGIYLLVLALLPNVSRVGLLIVPMILAALIDVARSIRIELQMPGMVAVWEERRASAVPVLRAALAADGIASETRGLAVLSLWQVFAPYAPAEILVRSEDAERATKTLRHWLLGEEAPERAETSAEAVLPDPSRAPWRSARRNLALAACGVAAAAAFALFQVKPAPVPAGPRPALEVVRIDDTIDPFAPLPDSAVPTGEGITIRFEDAPAGRGHNVKTNFARVVLRSGESTAAGVVRFRRWLETVPLPPGARFGIETFADESDDEPPVTTRGLRSFVLTGEPILRTDDVIDAAASQSRETEDVYVAVTLSSDGGLRFEEATREWVQRRIAILVDGLITSAPVVKTTITGGRISITMGKGDDPSKKLADAKALAARLRP